MIKEHVVDTAQNARRVALQEADCILESGCMTNCKLQNLMYSLKIIYLASEIERMHFVEEVEMDSCHSEGIAAKMAAARKMFGAKEHSTGTTIN